MFGFCFSSSQLSVWFRLRSPLIRMSERSVEVLSHHRWIQAWSVSSGPKPAVSVKHFTPASLAEVRLGTLKAWTGPGRFGNTFALKVLGKKTISLQAWPSVDVFKLPGHMQGVAGPRSCGLLPRHHTSERAWRSHRRWSRGSIPVGRRAPVNGQGGSLAPLGGCRWHQCHRPVWVLLSMHPAGRLHPRLPELAPAHVDEEAAAASAAENSRQTWKSTNQAMIWPEFELENVFMWIQFVVNLSQTICFSNGASVHEHQLHTSISAGRKIIFNYLLFVNHPCPL